MQTLSIDCRLLLSEQASDLLLQFLLEAVFLSGLGGIAGVATALAIGLLLTASGLWYFRRTERYFADII